MIYRDKDDYILYYSKLYDTAAYSVDTTNVLTPKEYGQKLLNRKRGRK